MKKGQAVGFILYSPKSRTTMELIQIDPEAEYILSSLSSVQTKRNISVVDISTMCKKWRNLFDQRSNDKLWTKLKKKALKSHEEIIDFFQGGKRYTVHGRAFSNISVTRRQERNNRWLFVLEGIGPARQMNLDWILRNFRLNRREHEIINLLLTDRKNKEIAEILGLSINTVKGYLKLLMKKLDVNSRTGIIARLMNGAAPLS
jgi:DNA-binding CsgD family transcriptional regulator